MGDLNTVTQAYEKQGGRTFRLSSCSVYLQFINTCSLIDLGFFGPPFTWDNGRPGAEHIHERLDKALANPSWLQIYPHAQATHLPQIYSDRCLILVDLNPTQRQVRSHFCGLVAWTMYADFGRFLKLSCTSNTKFKDNISQFQAQAPTWHKNVLGNLGTKKKRIPTWLTGIQKALGNGPSPFPENLQTHLILLYDEISSMEKGIWAQWAF